MCVHVCIRVFLSVGLLFSRGGGGVKVRGGSPGEVFNPGYLKTGGRESKILNFKGMYVCILCVTPKPIMRVMKKLVKINLFYLVVRFRTCNEKV